METAEKIVQTAEALIQERGYSGFSFQDVAERVGIKKGSLYYHFPTKAELGKAVIAAYRLRMQRSASALNEGKPADYWLALSRYLEPMVVFGYTPGDACLGGILAGEWPNLPEAMHAELRAFFAEHEDWLSNFLSAGRAAGAFRFHGEPRFVARLVFSAVEGSLLIKRIKADRAYFDSVIAALAGLLGRPVAG